MKIDFNKYKSLNIKLLSIEWKLKQMKKSNLISEIQSNLKKLSDTQLADVADYIEMIMGVSNDFEEEDEKYDDEDYDFLDGEDNYKENFDDDYY